MRINIFGAVIAFLVGSTVFGPAPFANATAQDERGSVPGTADLRSAMRRLAIAEENYYADHGSYTTDLAVLRLLNSPDEGASKAWLRVVHAGGRSWIADARTFGESPKSCVAYVGELADFPSVLATAAEHQKPMEQGVPVCDPE
jgi:hypothetical protein